MTVRIIHRNTVIANHLILHGYGHWLPNDPRGSGSVDVRKPELEELGPVHQGGKQVQPPRNELKDFYAEAKPRLDHRALWFDSVARETIAEVFALVVKERGYTAWGCAICANHAHLLIRIHREKSDEMWDVFARSSRDLLRERGIATPDHPVWSNRPYVTFKKSAEQVRSTIRYIENDPTKERLTTQKYAWVAPYDGWPHCK